MDGVGDNADAFPVDATETVDSDGDNVGDNSDAFPNDANESADSDMDGVGDNADAFPNDASETLDTDGDGVGDNAQLAAELAAKDDDDGKMNENEMQVSAFDGQCFIYDEKGHKAFECPKIIGNKRNQGNSTEPVTFAVSMAIELQTVGRIWRIKTNYLT